MSTQHFDFSQAPSTASRHVCDEAAQNKDRRFFVRNKGRKHYIRLATDIEETGYRKLRGIPLERPGVFVVCVRQIRRGFRIRAPFFLPIGDRRIILPTGEENCSSIFEAKGSIVIYEDDGARIAPLP